ncbi:hypothetical protein F4804DRAFT_349426 [Jackrogersella minutella]|nr:hypothetical protein F4804DRAFT_349426 [Jackrogersella minutella]
MTSYAVQSDSDSLPGSYPTDDTKSTIEHPNLAFLASQHQHNKLHKRDDPRGWSDEDKAARGHQNTDSGVGLTEPILFNSQARSSANDGAFRSNKNVLQNPDEAFGPAPITATRSIDHYGNNSKPGVMTGAYSRVDDDSNNQNYSKQMIRDSISKESTSALGSGATGLAENTTSTPNSTEDKLRHGDRNMVRNGLRQSSNVDHDDPYWGNVPHGIGIYNSVTGHGSTETTVEGSVHHHDPSLSYEQHQVSLPSTAENAAPDEARGRNGSRFKEGLASSSAGAGAGAGLVASELTEKQKGRHEEEKDLTGSGFANDDESGSKSGSKLASLFQWNNKDKETKTEQKYETKDEKEPIEKIPSKDKSSLTDRDAGAALAAAAMVYGAKDHTDEHDEKSKGVEHGAKENETNALYKHPNEKVDNTIHDMNNPPQQSTTPSIPAKSTRRISQIISSDTNNTYPTTDDLATKRQPLASHPVQQLIAKYDSGTGNGLAAAGVGAGAGYIAHEHVNKNEKEHRELTTQPTDDIPTTTAATTAAEPVDPYTLIKPQRTPSKKKRSKSNAKSSHVSYGHHDQHNIMSDGNMKDVSTASQITPHSTATMDHDPRVKAVVASAAITSANIAAHQAEQQNGDKEPYMETPVVDTPTSHYSPSHQGTYNVLSDGTPSGINTAEYQNDKKDITSSPSTTVTTDAKRVSQHTGVKAAAATAGVAGAGAAASHYSKPKHPPSDYKAYRSPSTHENKACRSPSTHERQSAVASSPRSPHRSHQKTRSTHSKNRLSTMSTDSSCGGKYNVLASGTPSGINIDDRDTPTSLESSNINSTASPAPQIPTIAIHPAAMNMDTSPPQKDSSRKAVEAGAGAGLAAAAAAALKSGKKVVHRCSKCNEENDITEYFQK